MYEKNNVLVFKWDSHDIPWDENLRQRLVQELVGKPIVIYVAGIRQAIGIVRQTRLGRDGIFADLVLETEELAVPIVNELAKVMGFKEIKIDYYGPKIPSAAESELKIIEQKLKIAEEFIYQPTDFEEYNQELALKGLPPSDPSTAAHTEAAKKFEAAEDLDAGELVIIEDGKVRSAIPKPSKETKPEPLEKKPRRKEKKP